MKNKFIVYFTTFILHLMALYGRFYLLTHRSTRKSYPLLNDMSGVDPIMSHSGPCYLVRGTSIMIVPRKGLDREGYMSFLEGKYDVYIGDYDTKHGNHEPWEKKISLEQIIETFPPKASEKFLFNLTKFN